MTDKPRAAALELLRAVREDDAYANLVLPQILHGHGLTGRDAAFTTELAYGTLRMRGWYDAVLAQCVNRPLEKVEPALLDALAELKAGNEAPVRALLKVEVEGVYSFAIFTDEFCDMFLAELDNYYATGLPQPRPNSMNNYGIIVNQIGMQAVITRLQTEVLLPLSELLFPAQAKGGFTGHHSFMVKCAA